MLQKTKELAARLLPRPQTASAEEVVAAREYIEKYWKKLIHFHPKDDSVLIGVPNKYLVPSYQEGHEFDYEELFYWDSYFMVQGMMDEEHKELVVGILENFFSIFKRFKIIPNASRLYYVSRSQPPFLSTFIWQVYDTYRMSDKWLAGAMKIAEEEYETVWMGTRKPNARQVYRGLSRYYDFNYMHDIAETESGWDMTTRFNRRCLDYLAVDLNALLYKYETDFVRYYQHIGKKRQALKWEMAAKHRAATMKELMWDQGRCMYYDFNYVKEKRGNVSSLASFYAMWAGMVDKKQAEQMVKALRRFENKGGLAATDSQPLNQLVPGSMPTQWAYPNGWAPLHFLVIQGLERYGYHDDARRIALKWLRTNLTWFNQHGVFLEKYNVVSPDKPPAKGIYPAQTGFGWTNAVFEYLCQQYIDQKPA